MPEFEPMTSADNSHAPTPCFPYFQNGCHDREIFCLQANKYLSLDIAFHETGICIVWPVYLLTAIRSFASHVAVLTFGAALQASLGRALLLAVAID